MFSDETVKTWLHWYHGNRGVHNGNVRTSWIPKMCWSEMIDDNAYFHLSSPRQLDTNTNNKKSLSTEEKNKTKTNKKKTKNKKIKIFYIVRPIIHFKKNVFGSAHKMAHQIWTKFSWQNVEETLYKRKCTSNQNWLLYLKVIITLTSFFFFF